MTHPPPGPSVALSLLLATGCIDLDFASYQFEYPEVPDAALSPDEGRARLSVGEKHACAVLHDGGVLCWGYNEAGQVDWQEMTNDYPGLRRATAKGSAVACGREHTCTIDGAAVHCWGSNRYKQLGNPDAVLYRFAEQTVMLEPGAPATKVMAGAQHTCIVDKQRSLLCWGQAQGFTNVAAASTTNVPTTVATEVRHAAVGASHTCYSAASGQDCLTGPIQAPYQVPMTPADEVFSGSSYSACLLYDGGLECSSTLLNCAVGLSGRDAGVNYGEWYRWATPTPVADVALLPTWDTIGVDYSCWLDTSATLWCAGSPPIAPPPGVTFPTCTPFQVPVDSDGPLVHVGAGTRFACALSSRGTVYCFGDGRYLPMPRATSELVPPHLVLVLE